MTRFAIDAGTALRLIRQGSDADRRHALVGPAVLRSDVLAALCRDVRSGRVERAEGRQQLEALAALKIRLLGDRVSRATAWTIAAERGWEEVGPAEYLAVAVLQADLLITDDPELVSAAAGVVEVDGYQRLRVSRRES